MNQITMVFRLQLLLFIVVPFGAALFFTGLLYGCSHEKKQETRKPTYEVSLENLQTAYAKSIRHQYMYSTFVKQAEKENRKQIASLYRAIARSEEIHARNHADLLRKQGREPQQVKVDTLIVGTVLQTLKMSQSSEEIEIESMYPNLIRTAGLEQFDEAKTQFEQTREADIRQAELINDALGRGGKIQKIPYYVCPGCGYIVTSDKVEECPVCKTSKNKFEKI
jgi:rubrerythrin